MRTSFHHQPEAQHPHSPAIYTPAGRLPHLLGHSRLIHSAPVTTNVRYASNSYRIIAAQRMTLSAMCGRLRVGKNFLHVWSSLGRCSHVFGL